MIDQLIAAGAKSGILEKFGAGGGAGAGGGLGGNEKDTAQKIQAGIGGLQLVTGLIKRQQARKMVPTESDPILENSLVNIQRRIRAIQTGTAQNSISSMITKSVKPYVGRSFSSGYGFQKGINQVTSAVENAAVKINQQAKEQEGNLVNMLVNLDMKRSQRKLELGMFKMLQEKAIAEQRIKAGNLNIMSSLANNAETGVNPDSEGVSTTETLTEEDGK